MIWSTEFDLLDGYLCSKSCRTRVCEVGHCNSLVIRAGWWGMMVMTQSGVVTASVRALITSRDGIAEARLARLCTSNGRCRGGCCWVGRCTMQSDLVFHAVPYTFRSRILSCILHLQQCGQLSDTWATQPSRGTEELVKSGLSTSFKMGTCRWALRAVLQRRQTLHWPTQPPFVYVIPCSQWAKGRMSVSVL